ncbi:hypothetical protein CVT26_009041 [Gymnopilus dilepis]|uniref:Methyltransferase domain-containing protein n=1 Tax=Gymnopilus dilepis TaxID=231916 RepID=A0A409YB20_9AGAR|nr:hypothetical protein CVT26_009041 [Gymnopilus dilepis]
MTIPSREVGDVVTTLWHSGSTRTSGPNSKPVLEAWMRALKQQKVGYASAEEEQEDDLEVENDDVDPEEGDSSTSLSVLRADTLERVYAIKWVINPENTNDAENRDDDVEDTRLSILDEATPILSAFSRASEDREDDAAPTWRSPSFSFFPLTLTIPERVCARPEVLSAREEGSEGEPSPGTGTGMLSLVAAEIFASGWQVGAEVVATDYHPDVLNNLRKDVETNFPGSRSSSPSSWLWPSPSSAPHLGRKRQSRSSYLTDPRLPPPVLHQVQSRLMDRATQVARSMACHMEIMATLSQQIRTGDKQSPAKPLW